MAKKLIGKSVNEASIPSSSKRTNVNIVNAKNGYVVSSYGDKGETTMIAKTKEEAKKYANKLLGL